MLIRPLDKKEVKEINDLLGDEDLHIPADAVCLESDGTLIDGSMASCTEDFSGISIVPATTNHNQFHSTCDTVTLIGKEASLALPIPLLPYVPNLSLIHI